MKPFRLAPLLLLAAGCRNPAPGYVPTPPEEVPQVSLESVKSARDLMPLGVGNHWTYVAHVQNFGNDDKPSKDQTGKVEFDIAARWPDGTAVVTVSMNGTVVDRQAWHGDATGLHEVEGAIEGVPVRPPMPLFPVPLKKEARFQWRGRGPSLTGVSSAMKESGEILSPQNVDLAKGTVSAIPVTTNTIYADGRIDSTTWFRPGVGIVRMYQETKSRKGREVLTLTLSEHTTKTR